MDTGKYACWYHVRIEQQLSEPTGPIYYAKLSLIHQKNSNYKQLLLGVAASTISEFQLRIFFTQGYIYIKRIRIDICITKFKGDIS